MKTIVSYRNTGKIKLPPLKSHFNIQSISQNKLNIIDTENTINNYFDCKLEEYKNYIENDINIIDDYFTI